MLSLILHGFLYFILWLVAVSLVVGVLGAIIEHFIPGFRWFTSEEDRKYQEAKRQGPAQKAAALDEWWQKIKKEADEAETRKL